MYTLMDKKKHGYMFCEITFVMFLSMIEDGSSVTAVDKEGNKATKTKEEWAGARKGSRGAGVLSLIVMQGTKATGEGKFEVRLG